ncbi:conserved membrane protein of unknown function [Rhodovastum atsumiense]|uniref:DUF4239 domain-containing protein n=1 Tax=Rhodovastum atsumiense TaxID=504468 RepID=A0A5M6J3V7_9PROT|nr:DUF4239 domain-containing protein [Rhodovastum atsumiense]KAA5614298.1 DUF4239 domain-containing protein [Rhodovastum atsumiense]CAH2604757.1 conserved membrane protein of unknown function [Rhodovastum atsumiense]
MIDTWLSLEPRAILFILAFGYVASAAFFHWISFHGPIHAWVVSFRGVVAPFFGSVAVLFALLTGFVARDVWKRNADAAKLVAGEHHALVSLYDVAQAAGLADAALRIRIRDYAQSVVDEEWPRMAEGNGSPEPSPTLQALLRETLDPRFAAAGPLVQRTAVDLVLKEHALRSERLALSAARTEELKWAVVLALSVLTQLAIALVHLEKSRAQLAALSVFSAAAFVALGLIAIQENPYESPLQVPATAIEQVLDFVPGAPGFAQKSP